MHVSMNLYVNEAELQRKQDKNMASTKGTDFKHSEVRPPAVDKTCKCVKRALVEHNKDLITRVLITRCGEKHDF